MLNIRTRGWRGRIRIAAWAFALAAGSAGLAGCGTLQLETGRKVNPDVLEQSLKEGVSTQDDIRRVLGEPYGRGGAMMPFHESPRTVWTYYYEWAMMDAASGKMTDQRLYMFVFLAGERFDGYMWFLSSLN